MADIIAEQQNDAAAQAERQAIEAEHLAAHAAEIAARPGATAGQKNVAAALAGAARDARRTATQAAELAAKPVTTAPATSSRSFATTRCAGPNCSATTTGATSGRPGGSTTTATCTAARSGCTTSSESEAVTVSSAGQAADGTSIPGFTGDARTSSQIVCPEAGCTGTAQGNASTAAVADGMRAGATAEGGTGCDGSSVCRATVTASASTTTATTGNRAADFGAVTADVSAGCDNGSATGCAVRAGSSTEAVGGAESAARGAAVCRASGGCQAGTAGSIGQDLAQVNAVCAGTGCTTHTDGRAEATPRGGMNTAVARSDCISGPVGRCAGASQVSANQGYALAAAGCAGSHGATCGFSYRAESRSRTGGSHAEAVAGQDGTVGGGQALAAAYSGPGFAQASAACAGSGGSPCHASYSAFASDFAEASVEPGWDTPGVYYRSYRESSCSGTGNGGCGVIAQAVLGDPDGGESACFGNCANFHQGGNGVTVVTAPSVREQQEAAAAAAEDDFATTDELGPEVSGADAGMKPYRETVLTRDSEWKGPRSRVVYKPTVEANDHGKVEKKVCAEDAPCSVGGGSGPKASYDPHPANPRDRFTVSDGVGDGPGRHQVQGTSGAKISRDAQGRTGVWVGGDGDVVDGRTGAHLSIDAPSSSTINSLRVMQEKRIPFETPGIDGKISFTGPKANLPAGVEPADGMPFRPDHLETHGTWARIKAGDGGADGARFEWGGAGTFTTVEGDITVSEGAGRDGTGGETTARVRGYNEFGKQIDPGHYDIEHQLGSVLTKEGWRYANDGDDGIAAPYLRVETPDADGMGGVIECLGKCSELNVDEAAQGDMSSFWSCKSCAIEKHLATGEGQFPGGWTWVQNFSDEPVTHKTPTGDPATCRAAPCSFTQINRDADGNWGGAICVGDCVLGTRDEPEKVQWKGESGLLYPNATDPAKNVGWTCGAAGGGEGGSGACGGEDASHQETWEGMPNPRQVSDRLYDPINGPPFELSEQMAEDLAGLTNDKGEPLLGRSPDDRRPLTESEIAALEADPAHQDLLVSYNSEIGAHGPSPAQTQLAAFTRLQDQSVERRRFAEVQASQGAIDDLYDYAVSAGANGFSPAEQAEFDRRYGAIDAAAPGLLDEWAPAHGRRQQDVLATWTRPGLTRMAEDAVSDPGVVEGLTPGYQGEPGDRRQAAIDAYLDAQAAYWEQQRQMNNQFAPRQEALLRDQRALNQEIVDAERRGYWLPGQKERLLGEEERLTAEQAAIERDMVPWQDRVDAAQSPLRDMDLVLAGATGNVNDGSDEHGNRLPNFQQRLTDANLDLSRIHDLVLSMENSGDPRQRAAAEKLRVLDGWQSLRYDAVRDTPLAPHESFLSGLRMPSTGMPDMVYPMVAGAARPVVEKHLRDDDGLLGDAWSKMAQLDPDTQTQLLAYSVDPRKASSMDPRAFQDTLLDDSAFVKYAIDVIRRGPDAEPGSGYVDWFAHGHDKPDEWDRWIGRLDKDVRETIEGDWVQLRQSRWDAFVDNQRNFFTPKGITGEAVDIAFGDDLGHDFKEFMGEMGVAPLSLAEGVVVEGGNWVAAYVTARMGDPRAAVEILSPSEEDGTTWQDKLPITAGAVAGGRNLLDSVIDGDWSRYDPNGNNGANNPFMEAMSDLAVVGGLTAPFTKGALARAAAGARQVRELEVAPGLRPGTVATPKAGGCTTWCGQGGGTRPRIDAIDVDDAGIGAGGVLRNPGAAVPGDVPVVGHSSVDGAGATPDRLAPNPVEAGPPTMSAVGDEIRTSGVPNPAGASPPGRPGAAQPIMPHGPPSETVGDDASATPKTTDGVGGDSAEESAELRAEVPDDALRARLLDRAGEPGTLSRWLRAHAGPEVLDEALDTIWEKVPDPAQRARLMALVDRPASLAKYLGRVANPTELERTIEMTRTTGVPGGMDAETWRDVAAQVRDKAGPWGGRLMVQGSRAVGVPAGRDSDIDFAILMDRKMYDETLVKAFGTTHERIAELRRIPESEYKDLVPGNERSLWYAANRGKISRGYLKLRPLGKSIQKQLGLTKNVDISAILVGGDLDQGPYLPLP